MEPIVFEEVYPLHGSCDIRGSSTGPQRGHSGRPHRAPHAGQPGAQKGLRRAAAAHSGRAEVLRHQESAPPAPGHHQRR
ncbi:MAG: hypothetical protein WKG07_42930 [Hymenobacter sp.]